MKIFISWSGDQARIIATSLKEFLPHVLADRVEPFISSDDIQKGQRSLNAIATELDTTDYGIVVLTKANQHAPWVNFEAGALGRSLANGRVAPLLVDVTEADITGPLAQFQMTSLARESDVLQLVTNINGALAEALPEATLSVLFREYWPAFALVVSNASESDTAATTSREPGDLLEEILSISRNLERSLEHGLGPRKEEQVAGDLQSNKVLKLLRTILGSNSMIRTTNSEGTFAVEVSLPEHSAKVGPDEQQLLAELATSEGINIVLTRERTSRITFFADGELAQVDSLIDSPPTETV